MIVETGGTVTFGQHMWVGLIGDSVGTLDINGGTVRVSEMIGLGWQTGTGFVNVNDGLLDLHNIHGDGSSSIKGDSILDIKRGMVTIDGGHVGAVEKYIAAGKITGFGTVGNVKVDFGVTTPGKTSIVADNMMDPFPKPGETVQSGDVELSWTNMDLNYPAGPMYVDVWFGTDPNKMDAGQYTKIVAGGEDTDAVTVNASEEGFYYWQVDSYRFGASNLNEPNMIEGKVFSFYASDDFHPSVDAGVDMVTWVDEPVQLTPGIDDDHPEDLTYLWTADPSVGVVFTPDAESEAPTVTVDNAAGAVTLTLTVTDAGNWNDGANWTNEVPGVNDGKAVFNVPNAAEAIVTDAQSFAQLVQGDNNLGGVIRIQDGGSIATTGGWSAVGYNIPLI